MIYVVKTTEDGNILACTSKATAIAAAAEYAKEAGDDLPEPSCHNGYDLFYYFDFYTIEINVF